MEGEDVVQSGTEYFIKYSSQAIYFGRYNAVFNDIYYLLSTEGEDGEVEWEYYNGTGWQTDPIWLDCYHIGGDEWGYDTTNIWKNDHDYTLTAQAFDAVGCSDDDSVDFTIHWPVYNISGTIYYDCGETGTIYVMLFDEMPDTSSIPIDVLGMASLGPYTFNDVRNGSYCVGAFMDVDSDMYLDDGEEPIGLAINRSYYAGEPADEIEVDGADEYNVNIILFTNIEVIITSPDYGVIAGDEPLTIEGTAYSPCSCVEAEDVSIALYYTNYSEDPDKTYYWNDTSGAWEWTTIIYNDVNYVSGGCGTLDPLSWDFTPATTFFHEGAYIHYIHVKAKDNQGNSGETLGYFTVGIPEDDFVSYWELNGDLIDTLGTNDGTGYGDVSPTTGQVGQGYAFDGDGDWVGINGVAVTGLSDWTWSGWVYPTTSTGKQHLYTEGFSNGGAFTIDINSGSLSVTMWNNWEWNATSVSGVVTYDQWNHITVTLEGGGFHVGNLKIYINGNLVHTGTDCQMVTMSTHAALGDNVGAHNPPAGHQPSAYFNGILDDIAVFDRVLSSEEIQQCYDNGYYGHIGYLG